MVPTVLRTAFLAYVRVLLCLQGMFLGFYAWAWWPRLGGPGQFWAPLGVALPLAFIALAGIVAAFRLRPGRRWAAMSAILIEALWAAGAAAFGYWTLSDGDLGWRLLWHLTALGALFLVAVAGLLLRPVRAYAGLVRH